MKKLYRFNWDCGRMGDLEGVFVAEEKVIQDAIGAKVEFGEVLGKHSEIFGQIDECDITVLSEDQEFIEKLILVFGGLLISGYNPLEYLNEDEEF